MSADQQDQDATSRTVPRITDWQDAYNYAYERRISGATFVMIAAELTERGYISAKSGKPVDSMSVRHMLVEDKRGARRDPQKSVSEGHLPRQVKVPSKHVREASAAELVPAIKKIVYMDDVTPEMKIKLLQTMLSEVR